MGPSLSAGQFERVYGLLRRERKIHTKQHESVRLFLEAVCWVGRSGAQWRLLPTSYGEWNSSSNSSGAPRPRPVIFAPLAAICI